jgi:hypothetical protein
MLDLQKRRVQRNPNRLAWLLMLAKGRVGLKSVSGYRVVTFGNGLSDK